MRDNTIIASQLRRNCDFLTAIVRNCDFFFAIARSCVAIFRNDGSQCVHSYAQLRRILIAMENMGID
jgi:hypothetical protein